MAARTRGFTFYELLGVSETADAVEITHAFRKLVKLYHPDSNQHGGPQTAEMFKAITIAYETLRDDRSRATYDAELRIEAQAAQAASTKAPREGSTQSSGGDNSRTSSAGGRHYEYRRPGEYQTKDDLIERLKLLNRQGRMAFWWSPSLIGFPFFAWLEARRMTGDKRYTRLMWGYLVMMALIGLTNLTGLFVLYWVIGVAHAGLQHRTVKAQAIARLASSR